jgi:ketosteroid isomerase-like protein
MSRENVEIVERGYEQLKRRVSEFMVAQGEMWTSVRFEPQEFIPVGADRLVVSLKMVAVGRDGIEVVARPANLITLQGGRVTHLRTFQTTGEALEAAGLSE